MVTLDTIQLENRTFQTITVELPETTLLIVKSQIGYIMCGALDIEVLDGKWPDRKIVAGRAMGVRTLDQLLQAPLESVTIAAGELGWKKGMSGREALLIGV
ncbi:YunC family protein [Alteribacillus sp. HJP-4]|uniref:YunC family protein n=1 Tax=Alteribacillus sp. HJP-4 TaxID=2775394 RepID=UPI0035CD1730